MKRITVAILGGASLLSLATAAQAQDTAESDFVTDDPMVEETPDGPDMDRGEEGDGDEET